MRSKLKMTKRERGSAVDEPVAPVVARRRRAFDNLSDTPCPVCLALAREERIQLEAVMPLPTFPARLKLDNRQCCRDCQATETAMQLWGIHPNFGAARLCVANERLESLRMPLGMAEQFGMCKLGVVDPASYDDLGHHHAWLEKHGILSFEYEPEELT